jgi:REP element-mobilizing transposase RayT
MRKRGPHKAIGLYAHITWHTWRRQRTVRRVDVEHVVAAVQDAAARCRVRVHSVGVLADHVHVVVSFAADTTLSSFIRESKSSSALRINRGRTPGNEFRWCRGYYANTLSRSHVAAARTYVGGQFQRHPELVPV